MSSDEKPWSALTDAERRARADSIRGKYKQLSPIAQLLREKQEDIDREDRGWRPSE